MNEHMKPIPEKTRRRWRRRVLRLGVLLLLIVSLLAAGYSYFCAITDRELEQAVEEADRLDPGWRLEELAALPVVIPDNQNAALCVLSAGALLPKDWPGQRLEDRFADHQVPQAEQINEEQLYKELHK